MLKIIGSQWSNILLRIVSALVLTPFLIGTLGAEGYGIWVFLNAVVGYLGIMQAGLPASSLRHLSEKIATDDYESFNNTLASSLTLFSMVAGAVVAAGALLLVISNQLYDAPDQWSSDGRVAFALAVIAVAIALLSNSLMTAMEAHNAYLSRNRIEMSATVLRTGLTVGLILWRPSLTLVAAAVLAGECFTLVAVAAFLRRRYPHVRIGYRGRDRATVRSLFGFSLVVFLMAMGARIAYKTDALVIGAALPMTAVSAYAVANTLALYLSRLINGVAEPLMPQATKLRGRGADDELRVLFLKWSKVSMSLGLMIGMFLLVLGPDFISWWINPDFANNVGNILRILIGSFIFMLPTSAVGFRFLMGLTRPLNMAVTYILMGVANLGLSALLVGPYGLVGVAIGTAIPNVLMALIVVQIACREIDVSVYHYYGHVIIKPLVAALPVALVLLGLDVALPVETFLGLLAAGTIHVLAFVVVWVLFTYRNDPYLDLGKIIRSKMHRQ